MTQGQTPVARILLEATFKREVGLLRLGRALWLYNALILAANPHGLAIRTTPRLAEDLGVPETDVACWVHRLVESGLVRVKSPAPYLVIELVFWPGNGLPGSEAVQLSPSNAGSEKRITPDSHSYSHAESLSNSGDRGPGEGEQLREAVRQILPDAESVEIERIFARYPIDQIRKTVTRVSGTPDEKIRKSKTALFRFLLSKQSKRDP